LAPEAGAVIQGTGGFRKLRWDDPRWGRGKRGRLRTVYDLLSAERRIWFFTLYGKGEAAELTPDQKAALKRAIQTELALRRAEP
jgi:hypothetical protein